MTKCHHDMESYSTTSVDVKSTGDGIPPPPSCAGLAPDALPAVQKPFLVKNLPTGVSTENALLRPHWYALRTTYGREKKAYDYFIKNNVAAFYPTLTRVKLVDGKRRTVEESRLPNIFFAYGTKEQMKSFVYDNVNLPYLRFYYRHLRIGNNVVKKPLVVPDYQIENLRIICAADTENLIVSMGEIEKFKEGQSVRIIEGQFTGVVGRVARYQGQQRVAVVIDGLMTVATAYIPSAFLEKVK
ncbi:UpxY family transcription antiterminator [Bacteroides acidifaciens]|uniref:UpxY family transcription antiterminator n=1 Tax=Bacteroides acidifaciens TaxID=85831 RepID=UPI00258D1F3A|nr:UpxY family transcription antiterminator [Bacteroides acidifaciens]